MNPDIADAEGLAGKLPPNEGVKEYCFDSTCSLLFSSAMNQCPNRGSTSVIIIRCLRRVIVMTMVAVVALTVLVAGSLVHACL